MDDDLLDDCNLYYELTGEVAHPVWIQSLPVNYLRELSEFRQGVRFHEDASKRDPAMK